MAGVVASTGGRVTCLDRQIDATDVVCLNAPTHIGCTMAEWDAGRLPLPPPPPPPPQAGESAVARGTGHGDSAVKVPRAEGEGEGDAPDREATAGECTQFACWGPATAGSDVDGGTVVGRNMDGECDSRKVTVTHLILLAIDPSPPPAGGAPPDNGTTPERGGRRLVSVLWPAGGGRARAALPLRGSSFPCSLFGRHGSWD